MRVARYDTADEHDWNVFVRSSKNGVFLFDRGYMDYHADRFCDFSLVVRDHREAIIAVLPASKRERTLISHEGLTFGGFVSSVRMTSARMLMVLDVSLELLRNEGFERLVYKAVPHIYHSLPAEEDGYALFARGANLLRRDLSSVVDARQPLRLQQRRRRALNRAERAGFRVEESGDFGRFWPLLESNLVERHGVKPVHVVEEINHLAGRFPSNIRLFCCSARNDIVAGAVVFVSDEVCHVQYNAASPAGRSGGAQDLVLVSIIEQFATSHRWIDLGISTEQDGRVLNAGLVDYKEGFGARAVNYDFYQLEVR